MTQIYPIELTANTTLSFTTELPDIQIDFPYFPSPNWQRLSPYHPLDITISPAKLIFNHHTDSGILFDLSPWTYIRNIRDYPIFLFIDGQKVQLSPDEAHYIQGKTLSLFAPAGSWADLIFITEAEAGEDRYTKY